MEYEVAEAETLVDLISKVNKLIALDWRCQGGICWTGDNYLQALVREKSPTETMVDQAREAHRRS